MSVSIATIYMPSLRFNNRSMTKYMQNAIDILIDVSQSRKEKVLRHTSHSKQQSSGQAIYSTEV